MENTPKKAVLYLRVSTEEQSDNYSLKTQEEICKKEAEKRQYKIDKIFKEEEESARSIVERPVLIKLLDYVNKHRETIGAIIVYRLDRISKSAADYLAIRKKLTKIDINLISATEPIYDGPTEKFIETMLTAFQLMDKDVRKEKRLKELSKSKNQS